MPQFDRAPAAAAEAVVSFANQLRGEAMVRTPPSVAATCGFCSN